MAQSEQTNKFPGFGLPHYRRNQDGVRWAQQGTLTPIFPIALDGWASGGVTLREKRMLDFINQITDKPDWETKVFNEDIVAKWKDEGVRGWQERLDSAPEDPVFLSDQMFEFCIKELRDKAESFKQTGRVKILDAELAVVKSDKAISEDLQKELKEAVKTLEDIPDRLKDWHPGSDETVLDLVHPSLFPVVWGVTRALPDGTVPLDDCIRHTGKGTPVAKYEAQKTPEHRGWGGHPIPILLGSFQWLPSQVEVKDGVARITSYINNLHPGKHKPLYNILERVLTASLPLFEDSASSFQENFRFNIEGTGEEDYTFPAGVYYDIPDREGHKSRWDPKNECYVDENGKKTADGEEDEDMGDDEDDEDDEENEDWKWEYEYREWKEEHRILEWREPREYISQAELAARSDKPAVRLGDFPKGLQVIFKLANIVLTPDKPKYPGGTWHVEGTLNERICASALYYFDQENIQNSFLAFRQAMDTEDIIMKPEQNEYHSLESFLGIEQEGPAIQDLGRVLTREGRLLVFPNCLQHQVQPFELIDKSRPGHRKILAMFLIDPNRPILSSAVVPPQRKDWWSDLVREEGVLATLPNELYDLTVKMIDDFPLSWEQAVDYRAKLMEERSNKQEKFSEYMEGQTFSFCEH
ncbi:hypothetical protein OQA88_6014 [Cercophora sp. LCS_1]